MRNKICCFHKLFQHLSKLRMMKIQNKLNKDLQSYRNQSEIFKIK